MDGTPADAATRAVDRLITAGKCKQAVELAKEEHKRCKTPETERRLVQAYLARIEQFQRKGMVQEAETLLALVRERFPAHRDRLFELEIRSAAAGERVDDLVAPLASSATPAAVCACVETSIRQHLVDLPALAECAALPAEHPLRLAAAAVWRAFQAATSGPVTDEQVALPEVSRRSPLAAWKMLVRALAAFYRNDDPGCERALEAIPPDAAVARLAQVLRAMMGQGPAQGQAPVQGGRAGALRARVVGDDRALRAALEDIETALKWTDLPGLKRSIRDALRACRESRPALYERLRQHISIACMLEGVPADEVVRVMGASNKDAYFWRLIARATEVEGVPVLAAVYWERFLRHALHEGTIAEQSLEAAMIYLHAAGLLSRVSLVELGDVRRRLVKRDVLQIYYRGQPPEIAAVAPRSDAEVIDKVLSPGWFYERAAAIHPDPETFRQWWSWAEGVSLPDRFKEDVARRWCEKLPRDPRPLLMLSMLAERRNALKLATRHLAAAEALDSLNPQVRQARVRLTLATTWRHFKDGRPHLVEKDLAELEALPGMGEGDRGAVLAALRAALHVLRRDTAAARQEADAVVAQMGPLAGGAIVNALFRMARLPRDRERPDVVAPALPDPHEVARAEVRIIRLVSELRLEVSRPGAWDGIINDVLREGRCPLSPAELLAVGRSAVRRADREQAYLASAAGLASAGNPAAVAGFLLVRAQSLATAWGGRRAAQCLRAALELARQTHDAELLREVAAEIERRPGASYAVAAGRDGGRLAEDVLAEVLEKERAARSFPRSAADADRHLAILESKSAERGPFDEPRFGESPFDDDDDDDDDEAAGDRDGGGFAPAGIPPALDDLDPSLQDLLAPLLDSKGRLPSPEWLLRNNPELLLRLLSGIGGGPHLDEATLKELVSELSEPDKGAPPGFFGRLFGRRGRKKKKRR